MTSGTWPNGFDTTVLDWMVEHRSAGLTTVVQGVTSVGNTLPLFVIAFLGVVSLVRRGHAGWAVYCGVTSLVAWGVMNQAKVLFGRVRPPMPERLVDISSLSFPSGHALNSMVVFGVLAVSACAITGRRWPVYVALCGSLVIGVSRVYLAAHWMTDVLAGWLIGAVLVGVGLVMASITQGRAARRDRRAAPTAAAG